MAASQVLAVSTATPYPETEYHRQMVAQDRIVSTNWDDYDTRHVVFKPKSMSPEQLLQGYNKAYKDFNSWKNIAIASTQHARVKHKAKHFFYASGWKGFCPK